MRSVTVALIVAVVAVSLFAVSSSFMFLAYNYQPRWPALQNGQTQGMMSGWIQQPAAYQVTSLTIQDAKQIASQYLASLNDPDLKLKEIMEFQYNFYIAFEEKSTAIAAFEMLIWKQSYSGMRGMMSNAVPGRMVPEPGPNMMWNTKYSQMGGMMGGNLQRSASAQMPISEQEAHSYAAKYLSQSFAGAQVEGITQFYGYYTVDFEQNGKIIGMLSVNGYNGQIWYHSWHGAFIQELEFE